MDVFSSRDLRQRSGQLFRDAAAGRLSVITKHGRPAILAVPFDERLLELGVHRALALLLFEQEHVTLSRAAKLADMALEDFIVLLGEQGVDAVRYSPDELEGELD